MVTTQDAMYYLGIDDVDDPMIVANVTRALEAASARMCGAVGSDVYVHLQNDPRVDQLVLLYTAENYDERSATGKQAGARSRLCNDLELQLRLELRALTEEAGVS